MKVTKRLLKGLGIVVATPIVLFLLLALAIYIPPVQNFVVHRVARMLSEDTGMTITVERVRLAFPLDLAVHNVTAVEAGDTLLHARSILLDIKLFPLFEGRADIDEASLYGVQIDSKHYISDTHIQGKARELTASAHGVDWEQELVKLDRLHLQDADFFITLSDTAKEDTTASTAKWNIQVARADIKNSRVRLVMPGDSMRIDAMLGLAALRGGNFDTGENNYAVKKLTLREGTIKYDVPYLKPTEGLDANHLALTNVSLQLDTLTYSGEGVLRAGLTGLTLREKCGLDVKRISGSVYMDSTQLRLPAFRLRTAYSRVDADVAFDFRSIEAGKGGHCTALLNATIGSEDIRNLALAYVDKSYLNALAGKTLNVKAKIGGNIDHLRLEQLEASIPSVLGLTASGYTRYILQSWRAGHLNFNVRGNNLTMVRKLMPASLKGTVNVPNGVWMHGTADFKGNSYAVNATAGAGRGTLALKGSVNLDRETYAITAWAKRFPLASFLVGMPLGALTGNVKASGNGFDVLSNRANLKANANISGFSYSTYDLSGIKLNAKLHGGKAHADFSSTNKLLQATGKLDATLCGEAYNVNLTANVPSLDLRKLGVTTDTLQVGTDILLQAAAKKDLTAYELSGCLKNNHFTTPRISTMAKDLCFDFDATPDTTTAAVTAGDLRLYLGAKGDPNRWTKQLGQFADELSKQIDRKELDQEKLKVLLPVMALYLDAWQDNPLYNILRMKGYSFSAVHLGLTSDPEKGMAGNLETGALNLGSILLDTISTRIVQDTTGVQLYGLIKNEKDNPVPLAILLKSYVLASGAGLELKYIDGDGEKGVDLGLQAQIADEGFNIHLYPQHPVIAYRDFTVNQDNFIYLGKNGDIRADVDLVADDGTGLKLYGEPQDSVNDLTLSLDQVNLGELSSVLPYLPKLSGTLAGDVHVTADRTFSDISAAASMEASNFKYEGTDLGNIGLEAIYLPKTGGEHHASAFISSNGEEVLACNGTYYDRAEGAYFEGDANLHDFPLKILNGFLTGTDVALSGIAGGDINVKGTTDAPILNGTLDLDSAHIYSDVYGFNFRTDERALEIKDSRLVFDDYNLYSTGKEPLVLNGTFDMSDLSRMQMDFKMRAQNFELINTEKKSQSMVYGKVYANFFGALKGTTDDMSVRGKLEVLDRTDMTYILKDSPLTVEDRLSDLVEFVSFADSTKKKEVKAATTGGFDLTLGITVSDAAQFKCNLSEDGQSYVNLEGGGDLTLRMTKQGDMRLTGRFTANSGKMKYELPVIPLKTFELAQGSYVEFTGDVTNPTLNITATERTKAVVTEDEKQRSVLFDVGVIITKPLNEMGLEFTIDAPEDLTIQNQLASMSTAQRSKAAVALMATGMYMTDESTMSGSGFKASNALNAFLQSEIQNIAGSALQTIDINLGVENNTTETGTTTTDYSFQFAKRFWGNRISVIIGGKISTGAEAQNTAESFINNVSVEYRLDQSATRYVKVFYDRNTQDPLEGQLTKTGAGLVLRRKTDRLGELFVFKKKKATIQPQETKQ